MVAHTAILSVARESGIKHHMLALKCVIPELPYHLTSQYIDKSGHKTLIPKRDGKRIENIGDYWFDYQEYLQAV